MNDLSMIKEGDHVMLKKEGNIRLFQICKNRDIWLEKNKFSLNGIVGHPYGTLFEVKDGQMVKVDRGQAEENENADKDVRAEEKDNRNLLDLDSNQKLTQEEIEQMKREGVSGDHLIGRLIENSSTFHSKTGYAQEKWVKKKKKKHLLQFTVLKPSTRLMCEMQWSKGPSRICNLRVDSLAQMMTVGNIHANCTVMVVDSCLGLVTGAVLERLGGFGRVVSFYHGDSPMKASLEVYDFPESVMKTLYQFPVEQINSLKDGKPQTSATDTSEEQKNANNNGPEVVVSVTLDNENTEDNLETVNKTNTEDRTNAEAGDNDVKMETNSTSDICPNSEEGVQKGSDAANLPEDGNKGDTAAKGKKRKKDRAQLKLQRARDIEMARSIILEKNVDCLLVATKFHPTPILLALLDFVAPSRQVVVFSQFKEALQDCYVYLREHKGLVNYRLTETWLRGYQVLPNRTHPVIQMSGTGGYLLSATTVVR